jgi:uncharacterized caspase-like protein
MRTVKAISLLFLGLLSVSAMSATSGPAVAEQQEKRIALVVGNGAYEKAPLATAANDAGLIAQTLEAAGFDVVGARDLDGDTLRTSFRDFMQKAESSGPDTVAMIYLSGYAVQLGGENYFIPVDASITRDTDIPVEGLRISDYIHQLGSIPLKASIFVLDVARQQPFIEGGQQIASGLALLEPENNMLIAFNAAPGTVAPSEPGPYGIYAQSLAEMIRTGGLLPGDVFDRVRLRVNETSKGAQVPWDAQKITASFVFFDRAPDAPPVQGAPDQVAAIRDKPIRELGVQDAYTAAIERDTLQGYEDFLAAYPDDPLAKRVRAIVAARREAITWRRTYRTGTPEAYWSYLRRYPKGPHAADARRRLAFLIAALEPPSSFAMIDYDVPPPPPDEYDYIDRPVLYFSDPDFGFVPPPPPPVFLLPPPPPDFVVLPPPFLPVGLFILPQPVFVPIPVFCRPPPHIFAPPGNVIFNNIHNTTVINTVINRPPLPVATTPGSAGAVPTIRPNVAGPALPGAVLQRALTVHQGQAPLPPSARMNLVARPDATAPQPTNAPDAREPGRTPPNRTPPSQIPPSQALPQQNALPGTNGTRLPPNDRRPAPGAAHGGAPPNARLAPPSGTPQPNAVPRGRPGPAGALAKPPAAETGSGTAREGRERHPPGAPPSATRPGTGSAVRSPPAAPPRSQATPHVERAAPSRPQPAARPAPPPHVAAPQRSAPPPRPAPPPHVSAPARPAAPPPMARPAAPAVHPAAPRPAARPAAPPRPAARPAGPKPPS